MESSVTNLFLSSRADASRGQLYLRQFNAGFRQQTTVLSVHSRLRHFARMHDHALPNQILSGSLGGRHDYVGGKCLTSLPPKLGVLTKESTPLTSSFFARIYEVAVAVWRTPVRIHPRKKRCLRCYSKTLIDTTKRTKLRSAFSITVPGLIRVSFF